MTYRPKNFTPEGRDHQLPPNEASQNPSLDADAQVLTRISERLLRSLSSGLEEYSGDRLEEDLVAILKELALSTGATKGDLVIVFNERGEMPPPEEYAEQATHDDVVCSFGHAEGSQFLFSLKALDLTPISNVSGLTRVVVDSRKANQLWDNRERIELLEQKGVLKGASRTKERASIDTLKSRNNFENEDQKEEWSRLLSLWEKEFQARPENETFYEGRLRYYRTGFPVAGDPRNTRSFSDYLMYAVFPIIRMWENEDQLLGWVTLQSFKGMDGTKPVPEEMMRHAQFLTNLLSIPITYSINAKMLVDKNRLLVQQKTEIERTTAQRLDLEKQLAAEKRLSALRGVTGQFAHSINNMGSLLRQGLTRVKGGLEDPAVLEAAKEDPRLRSRLREMYDGVLKSEQALGSIVETVKRSRSAVATDYFKPEVGDLNAALRGFALPAEVALELDPSLPALPFDATLLFDALSNAVANAQRALAERAKAEPGFAGTITVSTAVEGTHAELRVTDTGAGMTPEQIEKLMAGEQYTTKTGGEGVAGFGVGTIRNIACAHGGDIAYESQVGKGTTLKITLPCR